MSKKNKWRIIPFISLASLIVLLLYYLTVRKPSTPAEPLKAIPINSSVIIKVNDYKSLFEKASLNNRLWKDLISISVFKKINGQLYFIDSLSGKIPEVRDIINNPPSFISAHVTGRDKISVMHIFSLPSNIHEKKIVELINKLVYNAGTIKIRNYEGIPLHEVVLLNQSSVNNFSFAVYQNILLISFSTTMLEDAIRQLINNESLASVPDFMQIYSTAGKNVDANLFINFQQFPKSLSSFVKADFKSEVRSFKNFADWAELDLNPLPDVLLMNGFINFSDSVPLLSSLFINQSPQRLNSDEILPSTTASFVTLGINNKEEYFKDYEEFLSNQGMLTKYNNTIQSFTNAYNVDIKSDFRDILDNEMTIASDGGNTENIPSNVYVLLKIKSKTQTEVKLNSILSKIATAESQQLSSLISNYRFDDDLSFQIYHMPVNEFTSKIFGNLFSVLDENYFVILDNYLVFSGSPESLKYLIHNYILNKTLRNDPAYKEFKNNLSPRSNILFYCNLGRGIGFFSKFLTDQVSQAWNNNLPVFNNVQILGLQVFSNNNLLYCNFVLQRLSSYNSSAQTVWQSKLDTLANFKPVFVENHNTGQNEVFVQDLSNNIYLINQVGRVLWKIPLQSAINSEVYQIDYFRNGKLQFLFSTENEIYLIDRKGNFVEKYPIKLRSKATNGVAVFDYDDNREYRLFIACEDKHVYAYTREGNLLSGWEFNQTESEVKQPINHFRIGEKDFLVFGDRFKTYILDRKGNTRVNVNTYFPRSENNNYMLSTPLDGTGPFIVTTDTAGKAYLISFTAEVKTLEFPENFTNKHYFICRDLNGDGDYEYIYLEGSRLNVYSSTKTRLFTIKFDELISVKPQVYEFSKSDNKIGIVSRNKNQIYLINNNGELFKGFPLLGNTPFSIGNFGDSLSRFNLIVGSNDNFLYNYRVR